MKGIKFEKKKIAHIAQKYQLADIYLFGSRIIGFQRKESDLDIGVRFQKGLPEEEKRGKIYGDLFADLSPCFPGKKIDLVFIEEVPLHFQFKILTQGELIYSVNQVDTLNFQEKIFNYYRDYKFFIDEYLEGALAIN